MKRLDEMSLKELKKLYHSEKSLRTVPALMLIFIFWSLFLCGLNFVLFELALLVGVWFIFSCGRTCLVKWIIRVYSFLVTVGTLALLIKLFYDLNVYNAKFELTWQYVGGCIIYFGVVIVFTLIPANIFYISFTKNMWGNDHHTYKEISEAYNFVRKGESFADENLKKGKKVSPILVNIITVILFFIFVVMPVVSIVTWTVSISNNREELIQKIEEEEAENKEKSETSETTETSQDNNTGEVAENTTQKAVVTGQVQENSLEELIRLAESGDAEASYQLGDIYYRGDVVEQDYAKAIAYYEKAAELKNDNAIFRLGRIYYIGRIVEQNYSKALTYFLESAKNGNSEAQEAVAQMYFDGTGVEQNYYKAFDYYFRAAAKDNHTAQFSIGYMLAEGIGVEKNLALAEKYLEISAENGNNNAQKYLEKLKK